MTSLEKTATASLQNGTPQNGETLDAELASLGRSPAAVKTLEELHNRYAGSTKYLDRLIRIAKSGDSEVSATWLIKRYLEEQPCVGPAVSSQIADLLPKMVEWEAQLHILQCMQFLDLSCVRVCSLRPAVLALLSSSNKLVRAWAYDALYRLAGLGHSEAETDTLRIKTAVEDESAAVRARIRRLLR